MASSPFDVEMHGALYIAGKIFLIPSETLGYRDFLEQSEGSRFFSNEVLYYN